DLVTLSIRPEVRVWTVEGNEAPVGGNGGTERGLVGLLAVGGDTHQDGRSLGGPLFVEHTVAISVSIMDEDITDPVDVARDEMSRLAFECNEAPVGRERSVEGVMIGL